MVISGQRDWLMILEQMSMFFNGCDCNLEKAIRASISNNSGDISNLIKIPDSYRFFRVSPPT